MLTIIESDSNTWTIVVVGDELRIYSREEPGQWRGLALSDADSIDQERSMMLEELYLQRTEGPDDESEDASDDEEDADDEDLEPDSAEDSDEEDEEDEDEEDEEAETPTRRRSRTPDRRGGGSGGRR